MSYSLLSGGKRIRPLLVYAAGIAVNAPRSSLDAVAAAIEMIHTYSLIHDDLPAMDNSDLRRGQPTCHKVFGDGLAILAGDGLQALAFQVIAQHEAPLNSEQRVALLQALSLACGPTGMVAGQAFDILSEPNHAPSLTDIEQLYALKTGALLSASVEMAGLCAPNLDRKTKELFSLFGQRLGLAFQIQDDILDIEHGTEILGKPQGIDLLNQKTTYPALVGILPAKQAVKKLFTQAMEAAEQLGDSAELLCSFAASLLARQS